MKMEDVGYKRKDDGIGSVSSDKDKTRYPSLSFNYKIPDGLKKKDVGGKIKLQLEGEVVSKSQDEYGEGLTIEIHKIGYSGKVVPKEEYDKLSDEEKDKADEKEVMEKE